MRPMSHAWRLLKGQFFHPSIRGYIEARSPGGKVQRRTPYDDVNIQTFDDELQTAYDNIHLQTVPTIKLPMRRDPQTTLGEHHPDFPSPYGPVVYVHGTPRDAVPSIQRHGLIADHGIYSGNFVSTNPSVKEGYGKTRSSSDSALIGVRAGAGTPQPYFGFENDEEERHFPEHWVFPKDIDPKFLVNMSEKSGPSVLPEFYVDGEPPKFEEGMSNFDWEEWKSKWGTQV